MKRVFAILILLLSVNLIHARNYETTGTGMCGGVTLFDADSPLVGMNNAALLSGYGLRPAPATAFAEDPDSGGGDLSDSSENPRGLIPRYGFGRLYLGNLYAGANLSSETWMGMSYYMPLFVLAANNDNLADSFGWIGGADNAVTFFKWLTFGMLDISPLFDTNIFNMTTSEIVSNVLDIVLNGVDQPGLNVSFNANLLSYYRKNFGIAFYASGDVTAGLFGEDHTLLVVNDPVIKVREDLGIAVSVGHGEFELPVIGKFSLGSTFRLYQIFQAESDTVLEAYQLYDTIDQWVSHLQSSQTVSDYLDASVLGDGSLAKAGFGLAWDAGLVKKLGSHLSLAAKFSDVLSPVYWLNTAKLGWLAPDLCLGVKYDVPVDGRYWMLLNKPTLEFQIDDMLYTYPVSFLAKLHFGASCRTLFDVLEIGAGINQGYPTLGFSLHITPAILARIPVVKYLFYVTAPVTFFNLKVSYTLYGKELGTYAGESGYQGYNVGVETYIGL